MHRWHQLSESNTLKVFTSAAAFQADPFPFRQVGRWRSTVVSIHMGALHAHTQLSRQVPEPSGFVLQMEVAV